MGGACPHVHPWEEGSCRRLEAGLDRTSKACGPRDSRAALSHCPAGLDLGATKQYVYHPRRPFPRPGDSVSLLRGKPAGSPALRPTVRHLPLLPPDSVGPEPRADAPRGAPGSQRGLCRPWATWLNKEPQRKCHLAAGGGCLQR